jgi:hypothetical protein
VLGDQTSFQMNKSGEIDLRRGANNCEVGNRAESAGEVLGEFWSPTYAAIWQK